MILSTIAAKLDDDPNREDGGDAEPDLGAPEGHDSRVTWLRGTSRDLELDGESLSSS